MGYLYAGMVLFLVPHLFSILMPGLRDSLKARFGEKAWKGSYALISLVGLGLMIRGFLLSRSGPLAADWLYVPAEWARHVTMLLVLLAFIALSASHGKGYLRLWLRNPMSIGFALWAGGHLLANGKRADVYMFGTFLLIAILDIIFSTVRGKVPQYQPQVRSDIIAVIAGVLLYAVFLFGFHPYVLNLPIVR
jgi:uncharacterized membrane protein